VRTGELRRCNNPIEVTVYLERDEVQMLAALRQTGVVNAPSETRRLLEHAREDRLERRLIRLERLHGLNAPTLPYDRESILDLAGRVHDALADVPTEVLEVADWCTLLFGIHEELFDLLELYTGNPEPWRELLELAERLYQRFSVPFMDLELKEAQAELAAARRSLREAAYIYVLRRRGRTAATTIFPETDTNVLRRLNHYVH